MGKLDLKLFRTISKNICQTKLLETSHSTASKQQLAATGSYLQPGVSNKLATLFTVRSVNCDSRRSLRRCVNMAPVCRTKGESV